MAARSCARASSSVTGIFEFKSYAGVEKTGNKKLEDASELLTESVAASRVVAAFGLQPRTAAAYAAALREVNRSGWRAILVVAFGQSFERFTLQCTYAVAFFAGGHFLQQGTLTFEQLINAFLAVTLSAEGLGRITASAPDVPSRTAPRASCTTPQASRTTRQGLLAAAR